MKRYIIPFLCLILLPSLAQVGVAQGNPRGATSVSVNGRSVSVDYGRPSLRGKTIEQEIGRLQPGGFWRLGADSSTTFKTSTALKFGSTTIPAGTYSIWAQRQSDNSWKLVFNKQHGQWGTDHDASQDFAFIPLQERKTSSSADELVIRLRRTSNNSADFVVHWGTLELSTPFTAA